MKSRKSPRRSSYDYTSPGGYFVTICTKDRVHYFGEIVDGNMILNELGKICEQELYIMIQKRLSVELHEYIIMPNHIHLLLVMSDHDRRDTDLSCPHILDKDDASIRPYAPGIITNQSLGSIIGGFKSAVTKQCNLQGLSFARQGRYHDHIIRNETSYNQIKHYIQTNPQNRESDSLK